MHAKLGLVFSSVGVIAACFVVLVFLFFAIRRKCRIDADRKEEIKRLLVLASEESALAEVEAMAALHNDTLSRGYSNHHCVVCYSPTTKLCGRCKAVRYCSGKCQIIQWRQGHKDKCRPPPTSLHDNDVGSEPSQKLAEQLYEMSGTEDKEHPGPVEMPTTEPALSNSSSFSDTLYTGNDSFEVNKFTDQEEGVSTSELSSSGVFSSKTTDESSDNVSVNETISSDDIDRLDAPGSAKIPTNSLEATPCSGDNDQMKPLSQKLPDLVSSAHNFSKLSTSSCEDGENASAFNNSYGLSIAKGKGSSPSLREYSDFWGRALDSVEPSDDVQFDSAIGKFSSDTGSPFVYSFHLSENAATESLSEGSTPKNSVSAYCSLATEGSTLSNSACVDALGDIKDPSLDSNMSFSTGNDTCRSSLVLSSSGPSPPISAASYALSPVIKDAVNARSSSVNNISSDSRKADQAANDASGIPLHRADSSRVGCTTSISNACTTSSLKKKCLRIHDVHGSPAVPSEVMSYSVSSKNGLNTAASKLGGQFRESNLPKHYAVGPGNESGRSSDKGLCRYEMFVKLYTWNKAVLRPCGLTNCGNSCYANVVLQCLAFTPALTAYFLLGLHSKSCRKKDWCFSCEFERLVLKVKEGVPPVSPVRILSQLQNIGSHLSNGREEDAHEFLRYAIENMQSAFMRRSGLSASISEKEDITLIDLTFGGYLLSKIKCTNCKGKSERRERMMDLTVEIDKNIGTLEEALQEFTRTEILDGENKYHCSRCKTYEKAKKKLTVLEAPNVLTIALKRYQAGSFGKLNKPIRLPEILDMAPYMSGTTDKLPIYRLYAVVVHLDIMNSASYGHYVCYVKNIQDKWFKADDSTVTAVELDKVLTKDAYMLLYSRIAPRAPTVVRSKMASSDQTNKVIPLRSCGSNMPLKSGPASVHPSVLLFKRNSAVLDHPSGFNLYSGLPQKISEELTSDGSSLISSNSDEGSCSTRDSLSTDDFNDNLSGDTVRCCGSPWNSAFYIDNSSSSYLSSTLDSRASPLTDLDRYASCSRKRSDTLSDDTDSALGANKILNGQHRTSKLVELKDTKNYSFQQTDMDRHHSRILGQ